MTKNKLAVRAGRIFSVAGWYGILVLTPLLFLEQKIGQDVPPGITHPEFYYGFVGVGLAWQVLFLFLAKKPVEYRALMIPSILEKVSYGIAVLVLFSGGRVPLQVVLGGCVDLGFAALFAYAYRITR